MSDLQEPDRIEGAPHPRDTRRLIGQSAAEQAFLTAFNSGRLHQGWLITGPSGIGKATLAWRIARFLLATPDPSDEGGLFGAPPPVTHLDIDPEHPVTRRVAAMSEPGLFVLRRGMNDKGDKLAADIRVGEVRKLKGFFALSAADGGRRVVIVDSADELNTSSANAILKLLEEPPDRTTLLLISHQPARLLPTIRSRCRELRLAPLGPEDLQEALALAGMTPEPGDVAALSELAGGSVGAAFRLIHQEGLPLCADITGILASLPSLDRPRLLALSESCAGKGREARLDLVLNLTDHIVARIARFGVTRQAPQREIVSQETDILQKLAPNPASGRHWASVMQSAGDRARHARSVNVDPASLVTDLFLQLAKAAQT